MELEISEELSVFFLIHKNVSITKIDWGNALKNLLESKNSLIN